MSIKLLCWILGAVPATLMVFTQLSRDTIKKLGNSYGDWERFICFVGAVGCGLFWFLWVPFWLFYKGVTPILKRLERR